MNIRQQNKNGIQIIEIQGRIDVDGVAQLDRVLHNAIADGQYKTILDMGGVVYLNSAGLHTLARYQQTNQKKGGDLRLAKLSPIVQRVFQMIGFRRFFRNYSTVDAAMLGL
jgi:anti-sigma B factor antagonist